MLNEPNPPTPAPPTRPFLDPHPWYSQLQGRGGVRTQGVIEREKMGWERVKGKGVMVGEGGAKGTPCPTLSPHPSANMVRPHTLAVLRRRAEDRRKLMGGVALPK